MMGLNKKIMSVLKHTDNRPQQAGIFIFEHTNDGPWGRWPFIFLDMLMKDPDKKIIFVPQTHWW